MVLCTFTRMPSGWSWFATSTAAATRVGSLSVRMVKRNSLPSRVRMPVVALCFQPASSSNRFASSMRGSRRSKSSLCAQVPGAMADDDGVAAP